MAASDPLLDDAAPYQRPSMSSMTPNAIIITFVLMSICFSINHGAVTACLGLSSLKGDLSFLDADIGTWQSGTLYLTYTASAVFGAAYIVKKVGPRDGLKGGLWVYCAYVSCFYINTLYPKNGYVASKWVTALSGAAIGGVGGGFLWTAQGAYFGKTSEAYAVAMNIPTTEATAYLGGIFAFFYLSCEVGLKLLSTLITKVFGWDWEWVFGIYTALAVMGAFGMGFVHKFPAENSNDTTTPILEKLTSALRLLVNNPKMKYMIAMNAIFGFSAAFLTVYVTGQVVHFTVGDDYGGVLTAVPAGVASIMSLVFGRLAKVTGKGPILILGALTFMTMASFFLVNTDTMSWGWTSLLIVYSLMGIGRATFEGTLRATFADFFAHDKEGAFANIILQSGLSSALGFLGFPHLTCKEESDRCVLFKDDTLHNVWLMEIVVLIVGGLAVIGYLRAACLFTIEKKREQDAFGFGGGGDKLKQTV